MVLICQKIPKTLKEDVKTLERLKNPMPIPYSVSSHITECSNSNSLDIIKYGKICKKCQNTYQSNKFYWNFGITLELHILAKQLPECHK